MYNAPFRTARSDDDNNEVDHVDVCSNVQSFDEATIDYRLVRSSQLESSSLDGFSDAFRFITPRLIGGIDPVSRELGFVSAQSCVTTKPNVERCPLSSAFPH